MSPRPTSVPTSVTAGLDGSGQTDPFYLQGSYAVSWTTTGDGVPRNLEAALYRGDDHALIAELVSVHPPASETIPASPPVSIGL